uniref:Ig-like domain-containing protein n=1 Tax=Varanus komodoensis TaxID=61221 RepID=A0A8D2JCT0_VARKO
MDWPWEEKETCLVCPSWYWGKGWSRYSIVGDASAGQHNLRIDYAELDDDAVYECQATQAALRSQRAKLTVLNPPVVMLSVQPQTVPEGGKVSFLCTATSNPEVTGYRWAKGGVPIPEANGDSYEATVDQSFFTEPVSCEVSNAVGSTNVSTLVDVHFGPRLVSQPKPLTVDVGADASFTCTWTGNPPLTLAWTKKGSSVVSGAHQQFINSLAVIQAAENIMSKGITRDLAERTGSLGVAGPPIISTEPSQQTAVGTKARLECLVGSIPPPDRIAWAWGERVLDAGSLDRFSVDTMVTDQGVLSALLIDPTHDADFALPYNCTAWNRFGARSAAVSLQVWSVLILGALAASGVGALLILVVFVSLCYRRKRCRKGEDPVAPCSTSSPLCFATSSLLKPNRDPTNGYYKVRAHEEPCLGSGFSEYTPAPRPLFGATSLYPSAGPVQPKLYEYTHRYTLGTPGSRSGYDPHERLFPQENIYSGTAYLTAPYSRAFTSYVKPSSYEKAESGYEPSDQASKASGCSRFSYTSLSQQSDYGRPAQQRMQTHV